jgi:PIN domain nuclease of toxin-antitoxin system
VTRILLDTHSFLWFVFDDPRLSPLAAQTIENPKVVKLLSVVSLWEITIKSQLGKLKLGMKLSDFFEQFISKRELEVIDIELRYLLAYDQLPLHHRDPFDRMLLSQASVQEIPILSADTALAKYDIELVW